MSKSARITVHIGALPLTIVKSEWGARGRRGFCRFFRVALPGSDHISQHNPTETVANWLCPHAFRKLNNNIMCTHRSVFGMLERRMLSLCSHRVVTGDYWLYQTAKSWLQTTVNKPQQLFFSPTHSESRKPQHIFFTLWRLSYTSPIPYLPTAVFAQNKEARTVVFTSW